MPKNNFIAEKAALDPANFALANCIRALSIDAIEAAKSGHPGAPMGMADAATVLFRNHLKFDSSIPRCRIGLIVIGSSFRTDTHQ